MKAEVVTSEPKAELQESQDKESIEAIQEGLDAVDRGRVRPFEEFLAEHRRRYPYGAVSENHVLKDTAIERGR